ncbi:penicillin acylase family protein [Spongiactinospora sp. 9N601]|uniref:penicillin acylase family protein n=1 Tax=Spongiactinospora sp. 9N601 TaxID=3375149 RepID=UPI00379F9315
MTPDRIALDGADGPVRITFDDLGRPAIEAVSRPDAALGMGWCVAGHRRAQMEALWRRGHGTAAAVAGPAMLAGDIRQRRLGLAEVARRCLGLLPGWQRQWLDAFTEGVNLASGPVDTPWRPVASIAVAQLLYQSLVSDGSDVRMVEVMRRTLPAPVVDLLLSHDDPFACGLDGTTTPPAGDGTPLPIDALRRLMAMPPPDDEFRLVVSEQRPAGSNAWAVSLGDSAVLANDMHMELTRPSLWYALSLSLPDLTVTGVTVPGLPMLVAGTNGKVAWGFTRLPADVVDLREVPPDAPYRTRVETISVKGAPDERVEVRETRWGPVMGELNERPVAFDSLLLDPAALDFGLGLLYEATDVAQAVSTVTAAGTPPLNAILADSQGNVAWAPAGRFPARTARGPRGFSPATHDGRLAPLPPERLPRLLNPPSGHVVSCNNGNAQSREAGLGWNFFPGERARRVAASLAGSPALDERTETRRQLDLDAVTFEFYRDLALRQLPAKGPLRLAALREEVLAWRGTAHQDEYGLALLVAFRDLLRERLIAAVTRPCQRYDPEFAYCYHNPEAPLRRLVAALDDGLVPAPWTNPRSFVVSQILMARELLTLRIGSTRPVRWGQVNRLALRDLVTGEAGMPWARELSGCAESVCVAQEDFGASMRMTVHLTYPVSGLLGVPGSPAADPAADAECLASWAAGDAPTLPWPPAQTPPSSAWSSRSSSG